MNNIIKYVSKRDRIIEYMDERYPEFLKNHLKWGKYLKDGVIPFAPYHLYLTFIKWDYPGLVPNTFNILINNPTFAFKIVYE